MTRLLLAIIILGCFRFTLSEVCSYSLRMTRGSTKLSGTYIASAIRATLKESGTPSFFACVLSSNTRCSNQPTFFQKASCRVIVSEGTSDLTWQQHTSTLKSGTLLSSHAQLGSQSWTSVPNSVALRETAAHWNVTLVNLVPTSNSTQDQTSEKSIYPTWPQHTSTLMSGTLLSAQAQLGSQSWATIPTALSLDDTASQRNTTLPNIVPPSSSTQDQTADLKDIEYNKLSSSPYSVSEETPTNAQTVSTTSEATTAATTSADVQTVEYTTLSTSAHTSSEETPTSVQLMSATSEATTISTTSAEFQAFEYITLSASAFTKPEKNPTSEQNVSTTSKSTTVATTSAGKKVSSTEINAIKNTTLSTSAQTVSSETTTRAKVVSTTLDTKTLTSTSAGLVDPGAMPQMCSSRLVAPLPATALRATSSYDSGLVPLCAKLYGSSRTCTGYAGSWSPSSSNNSDYLQIDLLKPKKITGYEVMARINVDENWPNQWVTSFLIFYSYNGTTYQPYGFQGVDKIFNGNVDVTHSVNGSLPQPISAARYLRIQPHTYNNFKSLRIEIYGCDPHL